MYIRVVSTTIIAPRPCPAGEKPNKREVFNTVVPKIAHEWKYIAVQLEIEEEAQQIDQDYQKVKDKCFHVIVAGNGPL